MGYTTKTEIPDEVSAFYDRTLLERLMPLLCHTKYGQVRDIPQKSGSNTIKFRRYESLATNTTALSEGVTPAGTQLSVTDITADVLQYGDFVTLTDVVQYESVDANLVEAAQVLGEQAAESLEELCRDVIIAGTTVQYCDNRKNRYYILASSLITANEIREAVATLGNNNAKKITQMVNAGSGIGTQPINAAYVGITHPNVKYTIESLTGFVPVSDYANKSDVMDGEFGALGEVRFISTTKAKNWTAATASAAVAVYTTLILGRDAYGISRISGKALENIVKPLGAGDDPLNQRSTSGWKATFVAKILNDDAMVRIESSSAL